jgi:hypothetical protein
MSQGCEERQHSTYIQKKTKKEKKKLVDRYEQQLLMIDKDQSQ